MPSLKTRGTPTHDGFWMVRLDGRECSPTGEYAAREKYNLCSDRSPLKPGEDQRKETVISKWEFLEKNRPKRVFEGTPPNGGSPLSPFKRIHVDISSLLGVFNITVLGQSKSEFSFGAVMFPWEHTAVAQKPNRTPSEHQPIQPLK